MKKRLLCFVLELSLCLTLLPVGALVEFERGVYTQNDSGTPGADIFS